jgi:hypothetical protein
MEKVTIEQARRDFDDLIETVRKQKRSITVTGPKGDLVRVVPVPEPAYYFKGRPVYTEEQLASMDSEYPDETSWVEEILKRKRHKAAPNDGPKAP